MSPNQEIFVIFLTSVGVFIFGGVFLAWCNNPENHSKAKRIGVIALLACTAAAMAGIIHWINNLFNH